MNRRTAFLVLMVAVSLGLAGIGTASAGGSGATVTKLTLPITWPLPTVDPCNPSVALTGSISGVVVTQVTDQLRHQFLSLNGTAVGSDGTEYNVHLMEQNVFFHDPYPSWGAPTGSWMEPTHLKLQFISKGGGANFEMDVAVHFNEHGEPTRADLGGGECKG